MRVAGVDGTRAGWVAIVLEEGRFAAALLERRFADLLDRLGDASVVAADIPIGLCEAGARDADLAAAAALGPRRASVFWTPPRAVVESTSYVEANARCRRLAGRGVSKQAYHLFERIREVDAFLADERLFEVHPEIGFLHLAGEALPSKKTWAGLERRRQLLAVAGLEVPAGIGEAGAAGPDDVLDAAVAAWSAQRIAAGQASPLPDPPAQRDPVTGRLVAIWA